MVVGALAARIWSHLLTGFTGAAVAEAGEAAPFVGSISDASEKKSGMRYTEYMRILDNI